MPPLFTISLYCVLINKHIPGDGDDDPLSLTPKDRERIRSLSAVRTVRNAQNGIETSSTASARDVHATLEFDPERCRHIEHLRSTMRPLTVADLPSILSLYSELEMSNSAFDALDAQDHPLLTEELNNGNFIDRVQPSTEERAACVRHNATYRSSGEELRMYFEGTHQRNACSDFHAWGNFDEEGKLVSMYLVFLPPEPAEGRRKHAEYVRAYFSEEQTTEGQYRPWKQQCSVSEAVRDHAETTAEFYMIGVSRKDNPDSDTTHKKHKGLAGLGFYDMLQQQEIKLAVHQGRLQRWYLARFGALEQIEPRPLPELGDLDNESSRRLFKRLGFDTVGRRYGTDYAARNISSRDHVVRVSWNVMVAPTEKVASAANEICYCQAERIRTLVDKGLW